MYLVLFVLHDCDLLSDLLDAWEAAGVNGVTILHSSGLGRVRRDALMDDLPLIPSLDALFQEEEYYSRTLFTLIDREELIEKLRQATEKVVGRLDHPETGLMAILPVYKVYGLEKTDDQRRK